MTPPPWLHGLEDSLASDEGTENLATALVVLAAVAGEGVVLDEGTRRAAVRRSLLLLSAGGDPSRGLDLHGRAVSALAEDLRDVDRQLALENGIRDLRTLASGLPHVSEAVHGLIEAPDVAWCAYVCSLLAEELGGDEER